MTALTILFALPVMLLGLAFATYLRGQAKAQAIRAEAISTFAAQLRQSSEETAKLARDIRERAYARRSSVDRGARLH